MLIILILLLNKCLIKGRGCHDGQKQLEHAERESFRSIYYTSMSLLPEDRGAERTATLETESLCEQLGSKNCKIRELGQKKDERHDERGWDAMTPNSKIGEKQE